MSSSDVDLFRGYTPTIIKQAKAAGRLRNELAYMLATTKWETAHTMEPVREAYWLSEDWREANLRYYPFYGRGFVQLTWQENYERAQRELNLGTMLINDPDKALDPTIAADILGRGMAEGWFTGKKLSDYITLQKSDFVGARRIINGTDHASDIAAIAREYDKLLLEDGYGVEDGTTEPVVPDRPKPEVPDVTIDDIKDMLAGAAETINDLEKRVTALEEKA